jgi:hypothetical protein
MTNRAINLPAASGAVSGVAAQGKYKGISVRETAGAVASLRLWDSAAASGTLLETIALPANGSTWVDIADGVALTVGIYYEKVAGTIEGTIRIG